MRCEKIARRAEAAAINRKKVFLRNESIPLSGGKPRALLGGGVRVRAIQHHFGRLHIPVGKIAPQELVGLRAGLSEFVPVDEARAVGDGLAQARQNPAIDQREVRRLQEGNPGQHRQLASGVLELKIDVGPGYRVYCTQRGGQFILLLGGGDKSSQTDDIATAQAMAKEI